MKFSLIPATADAMKVLHPWQSSPSGVVTPKAFSTVMK